VTRYCARCGAEAQFGFDHKWRCTDGHLRADSVRHPWKVSGGVVSHRGTGEVLGRVGKVTLDTDNYPVSPATWGNSDAMEVDDDGYAVVTKEWPTRTAACQALFDRRKR